MSDATTSGIGPKAIDTGVSPAAAQALADGAAVIVRDMAVIDEPAVASSVLDPIRAEILAALAEPGSATTVAAALGLPRQKVNYHIRALEEHGLVHLVEERKRRGLTERIMAASARSFLLSPIVLGRNAADPATTDRLSTRYLIALAARMVREVAELAKQAEARNQRLATLAIDTEIRFGSPVDQAEFTEELAAAVTDLAARYHDESAPNGRWHRLVVAAHANPQSNNRQNPEPDDKSLAGQGPPARAKHPQGDTEND